MGVVCKQAVRNSVDINMAYRRNGKMCTSVTKNKVLQFKNSVYLGQGKSFLGCVK